MNPTTKDFQVFNEMKEMFLELGLPIVDEGHVDNYLFFASRMFIDTPSSENDLSIGYETKAKTIRIVSRLFQPVTAEKQGDLFEVFNYINCKLANVRLNIDPATQQIGLRGELALFGDPLNRKHFKEFIVLFFAAALKFFPCCHLRPAAVHHQRNHRQRHRVFLACYRLLRVALSARACLSLLP